MARPTQEAARNALNKEETNMTKNWLRRLAAVTAMGVSLVSAGAASAQDQVTLNWALWDWAAM